MFSLFHENKLEKIFKNDFFPLDRQIKQFRERSLRSLRFWPFS